MEHVYMFSSQDKILINNCVNLKNFSAQRLIKECPSEIWKTLDDFLRKLRITSSIERTVGSGRPRSSRTSDSIATVEDTV